MDNENIDERRQVIERSSYRKWEIAGRPEGDSHRFWYEAEMEYDTSEKRSEKSNGSGSRENKGGSGKWVRSMYTSGTRIWEFLKSHPIRSAVMGCVLLSSVLVIVLVVNTWPLVDESAVLTILKLAGIAYAAGSGTLALLVEFKDKITGRITRWGRVALVGIVVSGSVTAGAELISVYKGKHEAEENLRRRQEDYDRQNKQVLSLLSEIDRGLYPINKVAISATVRAPLDDPMLKEYSQSLKNAFALHQRKVAASGNTFGDGFSGGLQVNQQEGVAPRLVSAGIPVGSPFHPQAFKASSQYQVLRSLRLEAYLFRNPISVDSFKPSLYPAHRGADMKWGVGDEAQLYYRGEGFAGAPEIPSKPILELSITRSASDSKDWESTGEIVAIPDLLGSQVLVTLEQGVNVDSLDTVDNDSIRMRESIRALLRKRELLSLELHLGSQNYRFTPQDWVRHVDKDGQPFYEIRIPNNMEFWIRKSR
jgi:hypothetical protein